MADLLAPFQFPFMQNAFLISLIIAVPTAVLSCFLVVKGWALIGDAVSHAVLPGIVIAYALGWPVLIGAFLAGLSCAIFAGYLSENSRLKPDTVLGVVFSGMFALGLVLYVAIDTNAHLDHILYGNMLGVNADALKLALAIAGFTLVILAAKWRDFLLFMFDPAQARALGLPVLALNYGFLSLLSLTIVNTLSAVGLILAIGLLIAPGAIAYLVARRFSMMMVVASAVCIFSLCFGTYLSFFLDSSPAATVILVLMAIFFVVFFWKRWRLLALQSAGQ